MAETRFANTEEELRRILDDITFAPSCVNMGWNWEIEPVYVMIFQLAQGTVPSLSGWHINTTFQRPDTRTGVIGTGRGRKEFVPVGASESAVAKTAWLLAELIVRHELMEAFLFKGKRLFNPHRTVEQLTEGEEPAIPPPLCNAWAPGSPACRTPMPCPTHAGACRSPNGRIDAHRSYVTTKDGEIVCSFCKR